MLNECIRRYFISPRAKEAKKQKKIIIKKITPDLRLFVIYRLHCNPFYEFRNAD